MKVRIRELLQATPFHPFIIRMADGREYRIEHPDLVLATSTEIPQITIENPDGSHCFLLLSVLPRQLNPAVQPIPVLATNHKISGGKILGKRTRHVVNRAANVLRLIATALGKTDSVWGHFFRRIRARAGAPKAVTATARKITCLIYSLIKYKKPHVESNLVTYLEQFEKRRLAGLERHAKSLGFQLVPMT